MRSEAERPGPALRASGLSAGYGPVVALEEVDVEVPFGATVAVLGPNGSGKSSLFAAAVGLLEPAAGSIAAGGRIAWLPQHLDTEPTFPVTVRDVVAMGRWGRGAGRGRWISRLDAGDHAAVDAALDRLGITALADRRLHAVSGGQRQRALLAQIVAQDAGLILLDEPLTGVDRPTANVIGELIGEWREQGRAVMVATHDLESAARDYDLVLALNRRAIAYGPAAEACSEAVLRETFSGHVVRLAGGGLIDTSHRHHGAS